MGLSEFLNQPVIVVLFYSIVILLIVINRRKFEIQAKVIALYRTKIGLKFMDHVAENYREQIKILGYAGMGLAFIVMFAISFLIILATFNLVFHPTTEEAGLAVVLPGVRVPGSPFHLPLLEGIISIFIVIVIHEFSHGILARCHKIKVTSSGLVFFGPIPGAFVEPDEKVLRKSEDVVQYSILSAGPIANLLAGVIVIVMALYLIVPAVDALAVNRGYEIAEINETYPIADSGLEKGMLVTKINGLDIDKLSELCIRPDDIVNVTTDKGNFYVRAVSDPNNPKKGIMGVYWSFKRIGPEESISGLIFSILECLVGSLIFWLFLLNMGIGAFNLLPIGPTDGGRILQVMLHRIKGKQRGDEIFKSVSVFFLVLVVINIFVPIMGKILPRILEIIGSLI